MLKDLFIPQAKKTVDSVMSAFTATLADLEEVRERELAAAHDYKIEAAKADLAAEQAAAEAARAAAVAEKLRQLTTA